MRKAEKYALEFINRCNGWHSFDVKDKNTVNAIRNLAIRNEIDVSFETNQFRSLAARDKEERIALEQLPEDCKKAIIQDLT